MKRNFYFRRLKSRAEVGTKRRLNILFFVRGIFILTFVALVLAITIYFAVYNGYQSKLIQNVESITSEYKNASVILDVYPENDNLLLAFLDKGYEARKFTTAKIYALSERNVEELKAIIKKFPLNRVEFDIEVLDLFELCQDIYQVNTDKKTVIIANPDLAIRSATICNNRGVLAIPATIEDTEYLVYSESIQSRINELSKIIFEQLENN